VPRHAVQEAADASPRVVAAAPAGRGEALQLCAATPAAPGTNAVEVTLARLVVDEAGLVGGRPRAGGAPAFGLQSATLPGARPKLF
jgi:hypothetical protein